MKSLRFAAVCFAVLGVFGVTAACSTDSPVEAPADAVRAEVLADTTSPPQTQSTTPTGCTCKDGGIGTQGSGGRCECP